MNALTKPCPWTEQDKKEIRQFIMMQLLNELVVTRNSTWKLVLERYPIENTETIDTLKEFTKIYYSVQKEIKENTDTEKELIFMKSLDRLENLYKLAMEQKRYRDAKNIVDSLIKLMGAEKAQKVLDQMQDKDGNVEFHLDFGL